MRPRISHLILLLALAATSSSEPVAAIELLENGSVATLSGIIEAGDERIFP